MACLCCQLWFCCDKMMAAPCHTEWCRVCEHCTHQVAAASESITAIRMESSFAERGAEGEAASAGVRLLQGSQPGHRSLQLVSALPYHPQTSARYPTLQPPSPQPVQITEGGTLERCNLKHAELNEQPLDLKSEILKEQLCCLSRAGGRKKAGAEGAGGD